MSASGPPGRDDDAPIRLDRLRKRRELFRRYAELLSRELEAARDGDVQALDRIGERRSALHAEVSDRFPPVDEVLQEAEGSERRVLEELRRELVRCHRMNERLQEELRELRAETLEELAESRGGARERAARAYLTADGAAGEEDPEGGELNVTVGERPPSPASASGTGGDGDDGGEDGPRPGDPPRHPGADRRG